jgi:hypothetical protein
VDRVLTGLLDPVVRQNTIFLVALTWPWDEARPWLEDLRGRGEPEDAEDAEDALLALAFSGEPAAVEAFRLLARACSLPPVHQVADGSDGLDAPVLAGTVEARRVLRSYRAIEVLDRRPYYKIVPFHVSHFRGDPDTVLGWLAHDVEPRQRESLLTAWLDRYPGHPGSDNMAVRLGHLRAADGDATGAARWFARALTLPDQAEAYRAAGPLVSLCETVLTPGELLGLAGPAGDETPARSLFLYAHVRRLAAGTGFDVACRALTDTAAHEPDLLLSVAWRNRWSCDVTPGLVSGLAPLAAGDPLLRTEPARAAWPPARLCENGETVPAGIHLRWWDAPPCPALLLDPAVFDRDRLLKQMRAWDTLAELERRTASARGAAQADLLYKQAAVFYHDRDALFPCYERHTESFRRTLRFEPTRSSPADGVDDARRLRLATYAAETYAWERALAVFDRIDRDHTSYPAMDRVLFSQAMCWKRLIDYSPRGRWSGFSSWCPPDPEPVEAIRRCVETLDRLIREHPTSPLADDAERAAAYWRRTRPEALR